MLSNPAANGGGGDAPIIVIAPWSMTKNDLINRLMLVISDADRVIIQTPTNVNCGILSRFSLSVMAILLDSFDVDGLPVPGNVILLKRKVRNYD